MDDRISLYVLGLSYSQLQSGAYALILAESEGPRRIPVVIGASEAQSIAISLEGIRTPRPLTHDLFVSFAHAFGVKLSQVFIYRFEDGIFSSELTFTDGNRTVTIDARTSDAIAIALRAHAPIYTTPDILERTGFIIDNGEFTKSGELDEDSLEEEADDSTPAFDDDDAGHSPRYTRAPYNSNEAPRPEQMSIEQLEITLSELIDNEEYEEAERISMILEKKKARRDGNCDSTPNHI